MVNDKQWQENSDGWVTAMNKSKEKKRARKMHKRHSDTGVCNHGDFEWCDVCAFDINGERVAQEGIDY